MLARSVTKIWQESLDGPPSIGKVYHPQPVDYVKPPRPSGDWHLPKEQVDAGQVVDEDVTLYPQIDLVKKEKPIVPKRRFAQSMERPSEGLWTSHEFWMGIVVGAGIVVVAKMMLAIQAPYGINWY